MAKDFHKIGKFLKEKRLSAGLTQLEVAEALNYSTAQFISNMERGLCSLPLEKLSKLVKLYHISPKALVRVLMNQQKELIESHIYNNKRKVKSHSKRR